MATRKLNKSQRRAFARVLHFYGHSLESAAFGLTLTKGPLAAFFADAMKDDEKEMLEKLRARVISNSKLIHDLARRLEGFK